VRPTREGPGELRDECQRGGVTPLRTGA
jgi:hypothetical protein